MAIPFSQDSKQSGRVPFSDENRGFRAIPDQQGKLEASPIPPDPTPVASDAEINAEIRAYYDALADRNRTKSDGAIFKDLGKSTLSTLASLGSSLAFVAEAAVYRAAR